MTPHPDARHWDDWYRSLGGHVIATRTGGLTYEQSGRRDLELILSFAGRSPGTRVLEIGAGDARIARHLPQSAEVVCLEPSAVIAEECRKNMGDGRGTVIVGGSEQLAELPDASFDLIYSCFVLQHVSRADEGLQYLKETARLLRPGGAAVHEIRLWSVRGNTKQLLVDLARTPSALPTFSKRWRGWRPRRSQLTRVLTDLTGAERPDGSNLSWTLIDCLTLTWLRLTRSPVEEPPAAEPLSAVGEADG